MIEKSNILTINLHPVRHRHIADALSEKFNVYHFSPIGKINTGYELKVTLEPGFPEEDLKSAAQKYTEIMVRSAENAGLRNDERKLKQAVQAAVALHVNSVKASDSIIDSHHELNYAAAVVNNSNIAPNAEIIKALRKSGVPVLMIYHGDNLGYFRPENIENPELLVGNFAVDHICVNNQYEKYLVENYAKSLNENPNIIITGTIGKTPEPANENNRHIIFAPSWYDGQTIYTMFHGEYEEIRAFRTFLKIFNKIRDNFPDRELIPVVKLHPGFHKATGKDKSDFYKRIADKTGIKGMLISHGDMQEWLSKALFLFSANFSSVLAEAFYKAVPQAVYLPEFIQKRVKTGGLFEENGLTLLSGWNLQVISSFDSPGAAGIISMIRDYLSGHYSEKTIGKLQKINFVSHQHQAGNIISVVEDMAKQEPKYLDTHSREAISGMAKKNKKLRILFTMFGWDEPGGGTTFPRSAAIKLKEQGHEVAVFYAGGVSQYISDQYFPERKTDDGINLYGIYNRPTIMIDSKNPLREIKDEKILTHFRAFLNKFRPDIVHFHNFLGLSFSIADIVKEYNIPAFFTAHNYHLIDPELYMYNMDHESPVLITPWKSTDFFENSLLSGKNPELIAYYKDRQEKALDILNNKIDYTLSVSNRLKEIFTEFGADPSKIITVHQINSIAQSLAAEDITKTISSKPRFSYIGGIMPHKGLHVLAMAANMPAQLNAEINVYGYAGAKYQAQVKGFDKKGRLTFRGPYGIKRLKEIAANTDFMVLPSVWEDCAPLVIAESLAMGVPVIGPNIGGFPDFIEDGKNGYLYSYDSPAELAEKLSYVADNPGKINEMRQKCGISHNFDDYIEHLTGLYKKAVNRENLSTESNKLIFKK
ncbi:MAG: glycosyltransferase [Bacteroidota bacterium]